MELLDLLCEKLDLAPTLQSYGLLEPLIIRFGHKCVREDGKVFWGTDSRYTFDTDSQNRRRRDMLFLGVGTRNVQLNGAEVEVHEALCCQTVCFLEISNLIALRFPMPEVLTSCVDTDNDRLILALVRWLEPHVTVNERDSQHRPICPGPLDINHCLWRYVRSSRERRVLYTHTGTPTVSFNRQSSLFGSTPVEQRERLQQEKNAYYGLITTHSIDSIANMCACFNVGTSTPDSNTWLQTVALV